MENEARPSYTKRVKRFPLPDGYAVKEFVMRELDGLDDIEIAAWVDRKTTSAIESNPRAMADLQRHEAMRLSLVSVDGEPVNVNGVPYAAFDRWGHRTMVHAHNAFNEMNGVNVAEQKKVLADAVDVSNESPETHAAPSVVRSVG